MATLDYTVKAVVSPGAYEPNSPYRLLKATLNGVTTPVQTTDVAQLIPVKAGDYVAGVFFKVLTPEGSACTVSIGDGVTPAGYVATGDVNTAAGTLAKGAGTYIAAGKLYTVDDTIDFIPSTAFDVGKVEVSALVIRGL